MDARDIVDIPDTPDRVARRKRDGLDGCSLLSCSEDSHLAGKDGLSMIAGRNDSASRNQFEGRFIHCRRGIIVSEPNGNGRSSVVSAHRHSSASENASLFRKVGSKPCKPDGRYHSNIQHADNKKDVHVKCSSKPVNHPEHDMGKFVMGGNTHRPQKASPPFVLKEGKASQSKEDVLANNSLCCSEDPLKAKSSPYKGKEKINADISKAVPSSFDQQKCFLPKDDGSEEKLSSHVSSPVHSGTSARLAGRKRLVRNGCISPHNIAKAKQASETSSNGERDIKWVSTNEMAEVDPSVVIDVDGELSSGSKSNKMKGKEKVTHPFSSGEHDARPRDLTKRQKKEDPPLSSQDRDEEIMFIGSRSKPSSSGAHTESSRRRPCALDAVIDIDEHSSTVGSNNFQSENDLADNARQVEADEMLARELQEELYHEMPEVGNAEIDAHFAWMLQQEENVQQAPRSRNIVNPRVGFSSQPRRQSRSQLFQNRRGTQAQARRRLSRPGNRMQRPSRVFPSEMDLETRIEFLEALEAVESDISMFNQVFNPDRDFTEDDYDMLLALDENNHEHLGASDAQISNLPESVVQTSNCESCPICLEDPAIGETIRHLPCLHKFHKDCINSWLRRKRSCPVCKSDIA